MRTSCTTAARVFSGMATPARQGSCVRPARAAKSSIPGHGAEASGSPNPAKGPGEEQKEKAIVPQQSRHRSAGWTGRGAGRCATKDDSDGQGRGGCYIGRANAHPGKKVSRMHTALARPTYMGLIYRRANWQGLAKLMIGVGATTSSRTIGADFLIWPRTTPIPPGAGLPLHRAALRRWPVAEHRGERRRAGCRARASGASGWGRHPGWLVRTGRVSGETPGQGGMVCVRPEPTPTPSRSTGIIMDGAGLYGVFKARTLDR